MQLVGFTVFILHLAISSSIVQSNAYKLAQDKVKTTPSLKKVDDTKNPPSKIRKRYDRTRNATYLNIDIQLLSQSENKPVSGTYKWRVNLSFQLVYRGSSTTDLAMTYLIIESTAGKDQSEKLSAVKEVEIKAEGYQYSYERIDYKTELEEVSDSSQSALPLKKEIIVFKLSPGDLSQIANANRLKIKLGEDEFDVRSTQLTDLRSMLISGSKD